IKKSEQDFKKAKSHVDNIDNDVKRKEVKQLDGVLKEKYKLHGEYAKAYKKAKKQGMSLENDNVKVVRSNGEAKN
ncbi:YkyA family protein, partial [Staphylococcus aureus]|uniref:YkyA family protein n=1 Tax=Staphylococcus aureus TaxID=1280 RepID=UPI0035C82E6C